MSIPRAGSDGRTGNVEIIVSGYGTARHGCSHSVVLLFATRIQNPPAISGLPVHSNQQIQRLQRRFQTLISIQDLSLDWIWGMEPPCNLWITFFDKLVIERLRRGCELWWHEGGKEECETSENTCCSPTLTHDNLWISSRINWTSSITLLSLTCGGWFMIWKRSQLCSSSIYNMELHSPGRTVLCFNAACFNQQMLFQKLQL